MIANLKKSKVFFYIKNSFEDSPLTIILFNLWFNISVLGTAAVSVRVALGNDCDLENIQRTALPV